MFFSVCWADWVKLYGIAGGQQGRRGVNHGFESIGGIVLHPHKGIARKVGNGTVIHLHRVLAVFQQGFFGGDLYLGWVVTGTIEMDLGQIFKCNSLGVALSVAERNVAIARFDGFIKDCGYSRWDTDLGGVGDGRRA